MKCDQTTLPWIIREAIDTPTIDTPTAEMLSLDRKRLLFVWYESTHGWKVFRYVDEQGKAILAHCIAYKLNSLERAMQIGEEFLRQWGYQPIDPKLQSFL